MKRERKEELQAIVSVLDSLMAELSISNWLLNEKEQEILNSGYDHICKANEFISKLARGY